MKITQDLASTQGRKRPSPTLSDTAFECRVQAVGRVLTTEAPKSVEVSSVLAVEDKSADHHSSTQSSEQRKRFTMVFSRSRTSKNADDDPIKSQSSLRRRPKLKKQGLIATYLSTAASRGKARCSGPFRYLDLPPELRNRVYEYYCEDLTAESENWYTTTWLDFTHISRDGWPSGVPALLAANRQLFKEAASFFFAPTTINIIIRRSEIGFLVQWLRLIDATGRAELRDKYFTISYRGMSGEHAANGLYERRNAHSFVRIVSVRSKKPRARATELMPMTLETLEDLWLMTEKPATANASEGRFERFISGLTGRVRRVSRSAMA